MKYEERDMEGPFRTDEVGPNVDSDYIGVYMLSRDGRHIHYVGRSDSDIQGRIRSSIAEGRGYRKFWFCYESSAMQAYKRECYLYHKYDPPDNTVHPAVPPGTYWRCPDEDCEWGP
jgi:hypothetical protein